MSFQLKLKFELAVTLIATMLTVFIILYLSLYMGVSSSPTDDTNFEEPPYQPRKYALNTGQYIRREFKFIPEKESWQQKFAETISKAVEEEIKDGDYPSNSQDDIAHKEIPENHNDQDHPLPRTFISPDAEPQVCVSKGGTPCMNETTTLKPGNFEIKTGIVHVPPHPQEHRYSNNNEKGEILIHRPAPIIVNRPPTKVLVNHPPLIVKPAPVIFHRPPSVIVRQVFVKPKPEAMKMQPVYVKVIKPAPEKIYIKEQISCGDSQVDADYSPNQRYYPSQYNF